GGGRAYNVQVQLFNSRVPFSAGNTLDSGIPVPALGSAGVDVPSYFILVNVTWNQPGGQTQQSISQGTYVSPPN
ncbi:MAG TPA: hypothetical protein VK454_00540, partial [Myxococcaceae bacterium]|nr:hypothetical protein [Myxococcaceae bacterium]